MQLNRETLSKEHKGAGSCNKFGQDPLKGIIMSVLADLFYLFPVRFDQSEED